MLTSLPSRITQVFEDHPLQVDAGGFQLPDEVRTRRGGGDDAIPLPAPGDVLPRVSDELLDREVPAVLLVLRRRPGDFREISVVLGHGKRPPLPPSCPA